MTSESDGRFEAALARMCSLRDALEELEHTWVHWTAGIRHLCGGAYDPYAMSLTPESVDRLAWWSLRRAEGDRDAS